MTTLFALLPTGTPPIPCVRMTCSFGSKGFVTVSNLGVSGFLALANTEKRIVARIFMSRFLGGHPVFLRLLPPEESANATLAPL